MNGSPALKLVIAPDVFCSPSAEEPPPDCVPLQAESVIATADPAVVSRNPRRVVNILMDSMVESIKMFTTRRGFLLTTAGSAVAITLSACSGTQPGGGSSAEGLQNTSGAMTSYKAGDPFMATQALKVSMLFS